MLPTDPHAPDDGPVPADEVPPTRWRGTIVVAAAILLVTVVAAGGIQLRLEAVVAERVDARVDEATREIEAQLRAAGDLALNFASLEAASVEVTPAEFVTFLDTASHGEPFGTAFPGVTGVLVLEGAPDEDPALRYGRHDIDDTEGALSALADCDPCVRALTAAQVDDGVLQAPALAPSLQERLGGQLLVIEALRDPDDAQPAWVAIVLDVEALGETVDSEAVGLVAADGQSLVEADVDETISREVEIDGHTFSLDLLRPPEPISTTERLLPWLVLVAGAVMAALAAALVRSWAGSRHRAEEAVARATEDQRAANARLTEANRQLQRRNEELERFAGVVAHDLRAPLTNIQGMIEIVRDGRASDELADELLDRAAANTHRLDALVEELLRYASAGRTIGISSRVELDAVIAEAMERLAAAIEATGAQVSVGQIPPVLGDGERLVQVVQNLLSNALTHTAEDRRPKVEIAGERTDGSVILTVSDNGPGIPGWERDAVLAAFHRGAETTTGGTGLGLATVERIVAAHGGTIGLEDAAGGGLRVRVELPAA
jgi:signal transduction histidine kinase